MCVSYSDKYMYVSSQYTKAGAYLGIGICHAGISTDADIPMMIAGNVQDPVSECRIGAILGLALAYAGSQKPELIDLLVPLVADSECPNDIAAIACLALGYVCVGSGNPDVTETMVMAIMERAESFITKEPEAPAPGTAAPTAAETPAAEQPVDDDQSQRTGLNSHLSLFFALGLALVHLNRQSDIETTLDAAAAIPGPMGVITNVMLNGCAYAGTGNVLVVQKLLRMCNEHLEKNHIHQGVCLLCVVIIVSWL